MRLGQGVAAVLGVVALGALVACQPDFSDRMRGVDATFDDGRGTVTSAFGRPVPSMRRLSRLDERLRS